MQITHTAAEPPNQGRICLAIRGCTRKREKALMKMVPGKDEFRGDGRHMGSFLWMDVGSTHWVVRGILTSLSI